MGGEPGTDAAACAQLGEALQMMNAQRIVVGHTPKVQGIVSACDDRVWMIDTGLSAYYPGRAEILEIAGSKVRPLPAE